MATGTIAGGDDALRVDAKFFGITANPDESGFDVFDGGPVGAEAILKSKADGALGRGVFHRREEHLRPAAGPSVAMDPEHRGTGDGAAAHHGCLLYTSDAADE